ncbi:hypothetical protein VP01_11g1 [Puccinia sorghi]|uniref:Uncharacterized protein n=1 Tax=Puccinia sorghi TaxID=27349 RepID=A0A0L6VQJ4_9BASI|nr:hypothetical protein VP01_11g1 [Puccinia sorghi]
MQYYSNLMSVVVLAVLMAHMLVDRARGATKPLPIIEKLPPSAWICPPAQPQPFCSRTLRLLSDGKFRYGCQLHSLILLHILLFSSPAYSFFSFFFLLHIVLPANQLGALGAPDNRGVWDCDGRVFDGLKAQQGVCCSKKYTFVSAPKGNYTVIIWEDFSNKDGANCGFVFNKNSP